MSWVGKMLSDEEDSPGMEFIRKKVEGHEATLKAAATFSIVIWPDATSLQSIEGHGGDRSRNVNAIAKAIKAAVTGGAKGPAISSHPHQIPIVDKQDGSTHFACMRINFESKEARAMICHQRLRVDKLRAYATKIEVGQEEGGTTMNPTTMIVNWCEEDKV